jgi:cardiolipin synthase A/B
MNALGEASERGVRVRIIMDGYSKWRAYRGPDWNKRFPKIEWKLLGAEGPFLNFPLTCYHIKTTLTDKAAFVTGANTTPSYLARGAHFSDYAVVTRKKDVRKALVGIFNRDWHSIQRNGEFLHPPQAMTHQPRFPLCVKDDAHQTRLLELFKACANVAKERLWICTGIFSPDNDTVQVIQDAAERGVDVRIYCINAVALMSVSNVSKTRVVNSGGHVFSGKAREMHAKIWLVDDQFCYVGSANLSVRSLQWDHEMMLRLDGPAGDTGRQWTEQCEKAFVKFHDLCEPWKVPSYLSRAAMTAGGPIWSKITRWIDVLDDYIV